MAAPKWPLVNELCKFVQNNSGKRTDLKPCNNIISWLYTLNSFRITF